MRVEGIFGVYSECPSARPTCADVRRLARDLQKPLEQFRQACQRASRQSKILERRLVSVTQRLAAHGPAIGAAVRAAAAAKANNRAGRLLSVLST